MLPSVSVCINYAVICQWPHGLFYITPIYVHIEHFITFVYSAEYILPILFSGGKAVQYLKELAVSIL